DGGGMRGAGLGKAAGMGAREGEVGKISAYVRQIARLPCGTRGGLEAGARAIPGRDAGEQVPGQCTRPCALAGHLLARISAWDRSGACFEAAASAARQSGNLANVSGYLSNLALACTHAGGFAQASASHPAAI